MLRHTFRFRRPFHGTVLLKFRIDCVAATVLSAFGADASNEITFHKDVLPILRERCQDCHRPGEAAPMPFLTYQQTRPWAKAIRDAVLSGKMPPWHADPHVGRFSNA